MAFAAFVVAVLAFGVSIASLVYSRRQAHASESEAEVARRQDFREREPKLVFELVDLIGETDTRAQYRVRLEGPEDLDSVVVLRPDLGDGIVYPVARLGGEFNDDAEVGPLLLGQSCSFVLAVGSRQDLPEFRVRVVARRGDDVWDKSILLDTPRATLPVVAFL